MLLEETQSDHERVEVVRISQSGADGWLLTVALPEPPQQPLKGGHFYMLRALRRDYPFLNRPFSVHATGAEGREVTFLFKVVGRGTRALSLLQPGDAVSLLGPLGRPFPEVERSRRTVLVAGGVGLPPLRLYLQQLGSESDSERAVLLYGARSVGQLYELEEVSRLGVEIRTATEDGSHGTRGRVDVLLREFLATVPGESAHVLTCGPDPMMAAISRIAAEHGASCCVSLETFMGCGFGVCNACAVPVRENGRFRYARACIDGPVMDAATLEWGE